MRNLKHALFIFVALALLTTGALAVERYKFAKSYASGTSTLKINFGFGASAVDAKFADNEVTLSIWQQLPGDTTWARIVPDTAVAATSDTVLPLEAGDILHQEFGAKKARVMVVHRASATSGKVYAR